MKRQFKMGSLKVVSGFVLVLGLVSFTKAQAQELPVQYVKEDAPVKPHFTNPEDSYTQNPVETVPVYTPASDAKETVGEWTSEEESLRKARQEEVKQMKATQDKERAELEARQDAVEKHAQVEEQILRHKKQIQEYKFKQEQASENVELMKRELMEIEGQQQEVVKQLHEVEARYSLELSAHKTVSEQLTQTRSNLQSSIASLSRNREATEQKIHKAQMEMQRYRTEIAKDETLISRTRNDQARVTAEELRIQTEVADLQEQARLMGQERNRLLAEMSENQRHLNAARREYASVKKETDEMDREVRELAAKGTREKNNMLAEMQRIQEGTALANNQRVRNETEKIRIAAETNHLQDELSSARNMHEKAVAEAQSSEGLIMETRLAFETARADVASEKSATERVAIESDTRRVQARNLASLAESSGMLEGQATAEVVQGCHLRTQPSFKASIASDVKPGNRVIASTETGDWVKVLNSSGSPQYIRRSCLKFAP